MKTVCNSTLSPSIVASLPSLLLGLVLCAPAMAQEDRRGGDRGGMRGRGEGGPGGFPGGAGGGMMAGRGGDPLSGLLRSEEVQAELELMDDQKEALRKLAESMRPQRDDSQWVDFRDKSEEERKEIFQKMQDRQKEMAGKMRDELEVILLPDQMDRLQEISIQVRGVMALSDPAVAEELDISADQQTKLTEVRDQIGETMREKMQEVFISRDREAITAKMKELREEAESKALDVLTSEQKVKFEEMKGEPFDVESLRGGFGGGPGGGDRGGDRGGPGGSDRGGDRGRGEGGRERPDRPQE